jgi:NAD(P)-dependent dehydrogenase (short-subunit alcohol dehydrogenase family)
MAGRIVLVTGATSGIGAATARGLAAQGATVLAAGRDPERVRSTVERLRTETGNPAVVGFRADLTQMKEARQLAQEVGARYPRLDVLVNNAGAVFSKRALTPEGHERTWALNVLAPFQLTRSLEPQLRASNSARVVNVASSAHRSGRIDLADLERARSYSAFGAYGQSKLAVVELTYEWARRLEGRRITINALHPGFVASGFGRNNPGAFGFALHLAEALFAISPERGARTSIYLASSPEVEGVSGRYFARCRAGRSSPRSYDRSTAAELFRICTAQTEPPGAGRPGEATP